MLGVWQEKGGIYVKGWRSKIQQTIAPQR